MRWWDCFMFRGELDMLECRLTELEDSPVWRHVLVEADVTHRGDPKPRVFFENRERFARWKEKIVYVSGNLPGREDAPDLDPWVREHQQRNWAGIALERAGPGDRVLISDVDEIPSAAVWAARPPALLMQRVACFAADWLWPVPEPTGVTVTVEHLRGLQFDLAAARDARHSYRQVPDAGWHLSWMGGLDEHLAKLAAHCHLEQDTPDTVRLITSGQAWQHGWHIGVKLVPADVDETWPGYVWRRECPDSWFRPREEEPCPRSG